MPHLPSLILFARAPEPGRVKTRLAVRLTERGAAALYRAFLEDAAHVYVDRTGWQSVLCADPHPSDPLLAAIFFGAWRREAQASGDLGERLRKAFEREFARGAPAAVAVGSDHPALTRKRLKEIFGELARGLDAVLIPAEDGGYCAIGLASCAPLANVFEGIPWSSDAVCRITIARMENAGLRVKVLESAYDVDRPEDLDRLRRDLAQRDAASEDYPTATARVLEAISGNPE
ncbi:MAG TPA: TIGR04282 family arsenosugar biosynthesis glycosyltransferase [Thermoanaerobaculia bacterium]